MRFVGLMMVKNEGQWMERAIKSQHFCERIIVLDDHSTDNTVEICKSFSNVDVITNPSERYEEGAVRTLLLDASRKYNPDWVACIDGDESFGNDTWPNVQEFIKNSDSNVIMFRSVTLYGDENVVRTDGWWGDCWRIRLYKPPVTSAFKPMHECVPEMPWTWVKNDQLYILHYGYVSKSERAWKHDYYMSRAKDAAEIKVYTSNFGPHAEDGAVYQPLPEYLKEHNYS